MPRMPYFKRQPAPNQQKPLEAEEEKELVPLVKNSSNKKMSQQSVNQLRKQLIELEQVRGQSCESELKVKKKDNA